MSYGHFMVTFVVCLISTIAAVPVAHLTGFQGQLCVFEATPNRVYNLISTPLLQVNGRFVTVEDTMQVDQLGIAMLDRRLQIVSGPQSTGFAIVKMIPTHGITLQPEQTYTLREENGSPIVLKYVSNDHIQLKTEQFTIIISNVNSYLMMDVVWNDKAVLKLGQSQQTIDDPQLCQTLLNSRVGKKHTKMTPGVVRTLFHQLSHGNDIPVHGLIGQSWRNVVTCGNAWMGGSQDYEASSIFATDYTFNNYPTI